MNLKPYITAAKTVTFMYQRDKNNNPIALDVEQIENEYVDYGKSKLVDIYKGVELYYHEQISKFVPPDYQVTPEEEKSVESGALNIGFGAREISVQEFQMLVWYEDGLKYTLGGFDYNFTPEQMVEMAEAVINKEE